jgi:hypothetical protein
MTRSRCGGLGNIVQYGVWFTLTASTVTALCKSGSDNRVARIIHAGRAMATPGRATHADRWQPKKDHAMAADEHSTVLYTDACTGKEMSGAHGSQVPLFVEFAVQYSHSPLSGTGNFNWPWDVTYVVNQQIGLDRQ